MSVTAWRITKRKHAKAAFDGSGARKFGGRWNSPGIPVVYTAQSQSLAVLEILVHLGSADLLESYVFIPVQMDEKFISSLDVPELPRDWKKFPGPTKLQEIGDDWVRSGKSVALQVPSALLPAESNFLLNPAHPDLTGLKIGDPTPFDFDSRMY